MSSPRIRCAIYTRKSSDDGLEQDFNSLDAQFEACTAYIASQRHEGWRAVSRRYDDGGISGGTLERPALKDLLADIDAGHIDRVVVYKIDRLTRSLADFAKLVERLEAHNCSFVSVTQSFDTSTSMGRLTLHVLLSFAQFEREVTAERIRDKLAASKKKGLWMGGPPPLGYDPHPDRTRRELVINEAEAGVVRRLFALYLEHRNLRDTAEEAEREGLRSKARCFDSGRLQGGGILSRGQIHKILTNPVYRGLIRHKEKTWPGLHPAIIDEAQWGAVQTVLQEVSGKRRGALPGEAAQGEAPLKGKIRDETGDGLTPTHTVKAGRKIRYYISNRLVSGGRDPSGWRLPAEALEAAVSKTIIAHLTRAAEQHRILEVPEAHELDAVSSAVMACVRILASEGCAACVPLIAGIKLSAGQLHITLDPTALATQIGLSAGRTHPDITVVTAPLVLRRRGVETKIIAGALTPAPDPALIKSLRNAHRWAEALRAGTPLGKLAAAEGISESYLVRIMHLAGLSPRIQEAMVNGTQPVALTLRRLLRAPLPLDWNAQEALLGVSREAIA